MESLLEVQWENQVGMLVTKSDSKTVQHLVLPKEEELALLQHRLGIVSEMPLEHCLACLKVKVLVRLPCMLDCELDVRYRLHRRQTFQQDFESFLYRQLRVQW